MVQFCARLAFHGNPFQNYSVPLSCFFKIVICVCSIFLACDNCDFDVPSLIPNIFAISGKAIEVCPTLATATAGTPTSDGATITWTLAANAAAATTYTVEIFSDAAFTTAVTGSPFTGITAATYTATGLSPMTTYYFRVKGINADCTSAYVTGSFTTACATPAAPTAAAQTL